MKIDASSSNFTISSEAEVPKQLPFNVKPSHSQGAICPHPPSPRPEPQPLMTRILKDGESRLTANPLANLNLTKLSAAPISELTASRALQEVRILLADVNALSPASIPAFPEHDDIDQRDSHEQKRSYQERWNNRLVATTDMLESAALDEALCNISTGNSTALVYFVDGKPVGMLAMSKEKIPYIDAVVTHPCSETAGSALIERAVQKSVEWGSDGRLALTSLNEESDQAYTAMGFVEVQTKIGAQMILDPAASQSWVPNGSTGWALKKYIGKNFIG